MNCTPYPSLSLSLPCNNIMTYEPISGASHLTQVSAPGGTPQTCSMVALLRYLPNLCLVTVETNLTFAHAQVFSRRSPSATIISMRHITTHSTHDSSQYLPQRVYYVFNICFPLQRRVARLLSLPPFALPNPNYRERRATPSHPCRLSARAPASVSPRCEH